MPEHHVAQIRVPESGLPYPVCWVAEEIRWNGREAELVYDPRQVRMARLAPGCGPELRRQLAASGWRHVTTDSENAELWVAAADEVARARLDRLSVHAVGPEQRSPGIS